MPQSLTQIGILRQNGLQRPLSAQISLRAVKEPRPVKSLTRFESQ